MREDGRTASACARALGYSSEAAFHRAFKRVLGMTPRAWQKQERARQEAEAHEG